MRDPVLLGRYDPRAHSDAHSKATGEDSYVQQHLRDEVDINTIVKRFGMTGQMPSGVAGGVYGDFTGIEDYESAREAVERAQAGFLTLPPDIRERFNNDPAQLIQFAAERDAESFHSELGLELPPQEEPLWRRVQEPVPEVKPAAGDEKAGTP